MGDWQITHHWIVGSRQMPGPVFQDDRWATRYDRIAPGVLQLDTLQKYGYQPLARRGVISSCWAYDYLAGDPVDSFLPAFNYLIGIDRVASGKCFELVQGVGETAKVLESHGRPMLAVIDPLPFVKAHRRFAVAGSADDPSPLARLMEALYLSEQVADQSRFVLGLWTEEHGYVHTGELLLSKPHNWSFTGEASLRVTGEYNKIERAWTGPYAGSIYTQLDREPLPRPPLPWPFS